MLLLHGIRKVGEDWHVWEPKPPMYTRIYCVIDGNTQFIQENYRETLKKGWMYLFPAHAPYEISTDPEAPLECMYLHTNLQAIHMEKLIRVNLTQTPELTHMLQVIGDAISADYPREYLEMLVESLEKLLSLQHILKTPDPETLRFIHAIRGTYRTDLPVAKIAASMGYSCEYFIRAFKKTLGISPRQYAIRLRMSDAVRLLGSGQNMEEIAAAVGYADGHSFANAFRNYYGISPQVYRKKYPVFL